VGFEWGWNSKSGMTYLGQVGRVGPTLQPRAIAAGPDQNQFPLYSIRKCTKDPTTSEYGPVDHLDLRDG